jgi:hypothetical protein
MLRRIYEPRQRFDHDMFSLHLLLPVLARDKRSPEPLKHFAEV